MNYPMKLSRTSSTYSAVFLIGQLFDFLEIYFQSHESPLDYCFVFVILLIKCDGLTDRDALLIFIVWKYYDQY